VPKRVLEVGDMVKDNGFDLIFDTLPVMNSWGVLPPQCPLAAFMAETAGAELEVVEQ